MASLILDDAREYILPLFSMLQGDDPLHLQFDSRRFLGTAFFVTRQGDAITAAHVVPSPDELAAERCRLVAYARVAGEQVAAWIVCAASFSAFDFALLKVNLSDTRFLRVSVQPVAAGQDVQIIGVPDLEVHQRGKEMRIFKGYVTMASPRLELSISVPAGMSGSPVFAGTTVIGYATGENSTSVHGETTRYGIARSFAEFSDYRDPILDGRTLAELIAERNSAGTGR